MRFKLTLNLVNREHRPVIPINYQYLLSSWIYKVLDKGNPEIAEWLHEQGFEIANKHFRLFTFSKLEIPAVKRIGDKLEIRSPQISLVISFYAMKITEPFIQGIFRDQIFSLNAGNHRVKFEVATVEKLREPDFKEEMAYRCLSPIHIAYRNERNDGIDHLHPDHREYENLLVQNLVSKWQAVNERGEPASEAKDVRLEILTEPKKNGILIKEGRKDATKLIGYNFEFKLHAPVELK